MYNAARLSASEPLIITATGRDREGTQLTEYMGTICSTTARRPQRPAELLHLLRAGPEQ